MIPEQNVTKFLESFDRNNKIHVRAFSLFEEALDGSLYDLVDLLYRSGTNSENLGFLVSSRTVGEESSSHKNECPSDGKSTRFQDYMDNPQGSSLPMESFDENNESIKRMKISEKQADSSSEMEGIPGLGFSFEKSGGILASIKGNAVKSNSNSMNVIDQYPLHQPPVKQDHMKQDIRYNGIASNNADTVFYQNILPEARGPVAPVPDPWYLFPALQCKLCGLRFGAQHSDEFGLHIDDHRRFTNALGEKSLLRREFFMTGNTGGDSSRLEKLELPLEGSTEQLFWEDESPPCAVCGKPIKKTWDDKAEGWVLENATKASENSVVHKACVY